MVPSLSSINVLECAQRMQGNTLLISTCILAKDTIRGTDEHLVDHRHRARHAFWSSFHRRATLQELPLSGSPEVFCLFNGGFITWARLIKFYPLVINSTFSPFCPRRSVVVLEFQSSNHALAFPVASPTLELSRGLARHFIKTKDAPVHQEIQRSWEPCLGTRVKDQIIGQQIL